jgi:hypothetical protein
MTCFYLINACFHRTVGMTLECHFKVNRRQDTFVSLVEIFADHSVNTTLERYDSEDELVLVCLNAVDAVLVRVEQFVATVGGAEQVLE